MTWALQPYFPKYISFSEIAGVSRPIPGELLSLQNDPKYTPRGWSHVAERYSEKESPKLKSIDVVNKDG